MASHRKVLSPLWALNISIPLFKAGIDRDGALNLNGDEQRAKPFPQ